MNKKMSVSCKNLIKQHELSLFWLELNNINGIHNISIKFKKNEIKRLNLNPF